MIEVHQLNDRVMRRPVAPKLLDRAIQLEEQAPLAFVPDHALYPEEGCQPGAARHRLDAMHGVSRIEYHVAGVELDPMRRRTIIENQLAAVIILGGAEKERRRKISANSVRSSLDRADSAVHMWAVERALGIQVEKRRHDLVRQRRRHEDRMAFEAGENQIPETPGLRVIVTRLPIALRPFRQIAGRRPSVDPVDGVESTADFRDVVGIEDLRNAKEHFGPSISIGNSPKITRNGRPRG